MKVILDIKDNKAASLLEVLRGLSYVKTELLNDEDKEVMGLSLLMKETNRTKKVSRKSIIKNGQ